MPNVKLDNKVVVKNPAGTIISAAAKIMRFMGASVVTQVGAETQIDPNAGGGGGPVIIPAGGTISGSYNNNVICQGAVTMTGLTEINGWLCLLGPLTSNTPLALTVRNNLYCNSTITLSALVANQNASNLSVSGNLYILNNLVGNGDGTGLNGGHGSDILVGGTCFVGGAITLNGGNGTTSGGRGGILRVYGTFFKFSGNINSNGGISSGANAGGDGGQIYFANNPGQGAFPSFYNILLKGGNNTGTGNGGTGGSYFCYGVSNCSQINVSGGDADVGNGGIGGNVILYSSAFINGDVTLSGGNSNTGNGGTGGFFGGNGAIICSTIGPVVTLTANGGSVLAAGIVGNGGNAGYFYINGSMQEGNIVSNGGSRSLATNAGTAGNGATLNKFYNLTDVSITSRGGNNEPGSPAGKPMPNVALVGSNVITILTMADGATGTAPAGNTTIGIRGAVIINKTDLTDLGGHTYIITPSGSNFANTLKIGSMVGLNTLSGTGVINPNDFLTSNGFTWYKHAGVVA